LRFVLKELDSQLAKKLGRAGWKAKLRTYHAVGPAFDKESAMNDPPAIKKQVSNASLGMNIQMSNVSGIGMAQQVDDAVYRANSLASEIRASIQGTSIPRIPELSAVRASTAGINSAPERVDSGTSYQSAGTYGSEHNNLRLTGAPNSTGVLQISEGSQGACVSTTAGWENSVDDWFASKRIPEDNGLPSPSPTTGKKEWGELRSLTKRAVKRVLSFKPKKFLKAEEIHDVDQMSYVQRLVDSKLFTVVMALAIILNSVFIWAEENFRNDDNDQNKVWFIVDTGFLGVFSVEFLCKLAAMKLWYFADAWNLFDLVLVILGVLSLIFELMLHIEKEGTDVAGEARLIRLTRVFRVLRILRVFRLAGFYSILKAKLMHQDFSQNVAESLQSVTCLSAFVKAHIKSQEELIRFTGGIEDGQLIVEVARCLVESRTSVYQALALAVVEASQMDGETILAMNMMRECNVAADTLTDFVLDAHKSGMLNTREAETFLHPLRHCMHEVLHQRQQSIMGFRRQSTRINNRSGSLYGIERILDDAHEALGHVHSCSTACSGTRGSATSNGSTALSMTPSCSQNTPKKRSKRGSREGAQKNSILSGGFPGLSRCNDEDEFDSDDDPMDTLREVLKPEPEMDQPRSEARNSDSALPSKTESASPAAQRSTNRQNTDPAPFSSILPTQHHRSDQTVD